MSDYHFASDETCRCMCDLSQDAEHDRALDRADCKLLEMRNSLEGYALSVRGMMEQDSITDKLRRFRDQTIKMETAVEEVLTWLESNPRADVSNGAFLLHVRLGLLGHDCALPDVRLSSRKALGGCVVLRNF